MQDGSRGETESVSQAAMSPIPMISFSRESSPINVCSNYESHKSGRTLRQKPFMHTKFTPCPASFLEPDEVRSRTADGQVQGERTERARQ